MGLFISSFKKALSKSVRYIDDFVSKLYFKTIDFDGEVIAYKTCKPFIENSVIDLPDKAVNSFRTYNNIEQTEYLYKLEGDLFIEPFHGWILAANKKDYFINSFPYSQFNPLPSFYNIKIKKNEVIKLDKVISLRYDFNNYWHFINDVLGQITYIEAFDNDQDIPILIPDGVMNISYVKDSINRSEKLRNRRWIIHKSKTIINAKVIIIAKNPPITKNGFIRILDLLEVKNFNISLSPPKKIFIKRGNNRTRSISNFEEIEDILRRFDFEIVDNDLLSLEDQINLYSAASIVIGIHGAGLANLIFRYPLNLKLIEIFPSDLIPPHYFYLCNQLGFSYDCIIGEAHTNGKFYVNPDTLLTYLKTL